MVMLSRFNFWPNLSLVLINCSYKKNVYSIYFNFQCILLSTWAPWVAFDPEFVLVSLLIASGAVAGGEAGGIRQIEYRALIYLISAPPPSLPETEYEKPLKL